MREIRCSRCGQRNRVGRIVAGRTPLCGACHAPLPLPFHVRIWARLSAIPPWSLSGLAVSLVLASAYGLRSHPPAPVVPSPERAGWSFPHLGAGSPGSTFDQAEVPIREGLHRSYTLREGVAPFTVSAPDGDADYYVKLVEAEGHAPVMTLYVRRGSSVEVDVPLGIYRMRYASGAAWYGERYLFGPATDYREANSVLGFSQSLDAGTGRRTFHGHIVELRARVDGNLHSHGIKGDRF